MAAWLRGESSEYMPAKSPRCQASKNVAAVPSGSGVLAVTPAVGGSGAVGSGAVSPLQAAKKRERERKRESERSPGLLRNCIILSLAKRLSLVSWFLHSG